MYLESLQVSGFKSFAKKTTFRFNDGITAIVGPNGCGKSNTVDAIRWVLGEQRAGIIRSEKMENVIFNGTKDVKPLGMAEVSLHIHNTKNVLPIEYSEVVITRRLFRSLESQYLLNNSPCRLKDIQDLFMDTGMGPGAYSIIELNMVETILNGRPEERRRIIEEAAGVTKYKMRRKAAFRKLEATEADLLRVNDIISEVEKTVSSLQRQVRRAQRYQNVSESLKENEVLLATTQFSEIQNELAPLVIKLTETQNSRVSLATRFGEKEAEIEETRRQLLDVERRLSEQQRALNAVSMRIQKKEEDILVGRERRKALENARVKLLRDQEEVRQKLEKNRLQDAGFKEDLQTLFEKIQVAESDFSEKNALLNKLDHKLTEKKEQLKAVEFQRLKAVEGLTEGKRDEERIKTQLANIRERLTTVARELEENDLLQKIRQEKVDRALQKKAEAEAELRQIRNDLQEVQARIKDLAQRREDVKERILKRRTEVETLKERIELLKKFIESYEDHPAGVQHILLEAPLNGGCKGTLAENLKVKSQYRRAVETAIGEASVSLIVDGTDQAFQCIELLKAGDKGAVTFFPLDRFHNDGKTNSDDSAHVEMSDGMIDWAYNLVDCDKRYHQLVAALLRDYVVVKDLDAAQGYAERYREMRLNLVTLNGEVISTWGPIKGGATEASQGAIIGRKALVEELEAGLGETYNHLDAEENERIRIEREYQQAFAREQELTNKLKRAENSANEVGMQLAQLDFESKKDAELRERLLREKGEQIENQEALNSEFEKISPSLSDLVDNKSQSESTLQKINEEQSVLEEEIREQRTVAQDSRVTLADLKSEEKHLQENMANLQTYQAELNEACTRIEHEMENAAVELQEIEKRINTNKTEIEADFKEHQELQSKIEKLEAEFRKSKEELQMREKFIREIRDEKDSVSETLHALELRISELKMTAEKIREKIKEEYDVEIQKADLHADLDVTRVAADIVRDKERLNAMGPVNLLALKEYEKEKERFDFLVTQRDDLVEAEKNLTDTIRVINKTAREQFSAIFQDIVENFTKVFQGFFKDGQANLYLSDDGDPLEADVVIEADPKGRRVAALSLLSGGEKTLTAISLLFAIYLVKPSPFCVLDEVDAPLDDANIGRFVSAIREFAVNTQFLIVTHNKLTMREADALYGVTMEQEGVSKVVSVNFKEMEGLAA